MDSPRGWRAGLLLVLGFAVFYLPWLDAEAPRIGLESTRVLVAREMQRGGDWVVPTQNGAAYLAKPPLWYWMLALGSAPFGEVTLVRARLVAALCTLAVALAAWRFAAREFGARAGFLAGAAVLGSGLVAEKGLRAELEIALALFTTLAIVTLHAAAWSDRRRLARATLAGLALGAALLVKGPVAWLAFVPAWIALVLASPSRRRGAIACGAIALVASVLVGGSWLALLFARVDPDTGAHKLWSEVADRVLHAGGTNREPFWFYAPALVAAFAPASLLLPGVVSRRGPWRDGDERARSAIFLLVGWSAGFVLLLSFSSGKETRYLLPAIPGLAILTAACWLRDDASRAFARYRDFVTRAIRGLAWLAPLALAVVGVARHAEAEPATWIAVALTLLGAVAIQIGVRRRAGAWHAGAWLCMLGGVRAFWAGVPISALNARYPIERLCADVAARLEPGEPLVEVDRYHSQFQLLVDRPFRLAERVEDVPGELAPPGLRRARYVLASIESLPPGAEAGLVEVAAWPYAGSRYRLLRAP